MKIHLPNRVVSISVLLVACMSLPVDGMVEVVFRQNEKSMRVVGKVLVEAADGGILLQGRDTKIWVIQPTQLVSKSADDGVEFSLLSKNELKAKLLHELPVGFQIYETANYVICYNTSKAYAQWCGSLYERLYRAYFNYWRNRQFRLDEPSVLVSIVFHDQPSFQRYAQTEMGEAAKSVIGFYSLQSNAITTYDLTGVGSIGQGRTATNSRQINALLSNPQAERTVATLIHESTHQLVFNSGLQTRFADIPVWLSEGMAIFFETPDLQSRKGWRTVGALNQFRHTQMLDYLGRRPSNSLNSLIVDDQRFRNARDAGSAYAEAWALTYFLIKYHPKEFQTFLQTLQKKTALGSDSPEQRLLDFQSSFGDELEALELQFLQFISTTK